MSVKFDTAKLTSLAQQLAGIVATFNPAAAATFGGIAVVVAELGGILAQVERDDPGMWADVQADFGGAVNAWKASNATPPKPAKP